MEEDLIEAFKEIEQIKERLKDLEEVVKELIRILESKEPTKPSEPKKMLRAEIYGFANEADKEKFIKICKDIAAKDETFNFKITERNITIYGDDKENLHKRGMWLVKRTGLEGLKYSVKEEKV